MKPVRVSNNTRLIVGLFTLLLVLQLLTYFVTAVYGRDLPMGRMALGVIVFGVIAAYYNSNNLWQRIGRDQWGALFCLYIAFSFIYGFWRFRTPTTSMFDLWFFAFIPAILLIPPFSFNVRTFDKILATGVLLSVCSVVIALIAFPDVLYDRALFTDYVSQLSVIGAGAGYLFLKYADRPNAFTLIGLAGVLADGVVYGVAGAFRGRLILAFLLLLLFLFVMLRSRRSGSGMKLLAISGSAVAVTIAIFFTVTQLGEQIYTVTDRFMGLQERYEKTGDLAATDSRILEYQYFMQLNPNWKLILGHGVGGLWYDYYGMFKENEGDGDGLAGARAMLHLNWIHVIFKIGIVGFFLLLGMLVSHYRKHRVFLRQNLGWWAFAFFYCVWTTYYGDKELGIRSIIFLIVLIHPWLFQAEASERRQPVVSSGRLIHGGCRLQRNPQRALIN